MKRVPWITVALSVFALLVQSFGNPLSEMLQWRSDWFASGEVWRAMSGHFCHWNWEHLGWDLAVFAVLGGHIERRARGRFLAALALTVLATDPLLRWSGAFESYRGLSGVAVALFVLAALEIFEAGRRKGDRILTLGGALALAGLAVKIALEMGTERTLFAGSGDFSLAVEAHLAGALSGLVSWGLARRRPAETRGL